MSRPSGEHDADRKITRSVQKALLRLPLASGKAIASVRIASGNGTRVALQFVLQFRQSVSGGSR